MGQNGKHASPLPHLLIVLFSYSLHPLQDDTVWYEVLSFSKPQHWMTKLGYPIARYMSTTKP
jgi:hypothetical protein